MQIRYLPIGSVCSIDNSNNKYMVIGYKKNDYDFVSVLYPDGYLNNENFIYFNEGQVNEIYSLGYKDEYGIMFSKKMNIEETPLDEPQSGDVEEPQEEIVPSQSDSTSPYVFDENGTVIAVNEPKQEVSASVEESTSPYIFDENGTIIGVNEPKQEVSAPVEEDKGIFASPYIFDENGVVIDINNSNTEKTETVEENDVSSDDSKIIKGDSRYIFNEEGMVIAVKPEESKEEVTASVEESASPYIFDENGTIIGVNEPKQEISTSEVQEEVPVEENKPVENRKYVFDENGFLVSAE